jgi:hypothetical protein
MFCDENLPSEWPVLTLTAWCSPGSTIWLREVLNALKIVKPETVIRWHRAGFRAYWRRRSGQRGGRPQTPLEIRRLIRDVSLANPLWGAPRIHGELLKLDIEIGADHGRQVHGQAAAPAIAGLENVP